MVDSSGAFLSLCVVTEVSDEEEVAAGGALGVVAAGDQLVAAAMQTSEQLHRLGPQRRVIWSGACPGSGRCLCPRLLAHSHRRFPRGIGIGVGIGVGSSQ